MFSLLGSVCLFVRRFFLYFYCIPLLVLVYMLSFRQMWNWYWPKHQHSAFSIRLWRASPITIFIMEAKVINIELKRGLFSIYLKATSSPFKFFLVLFQFSLIPFYKKIFFNGGVSRNSRFPWFPGIQASNFPFLPFPWHFKFSLPVPGKRKFWTGIRTGNTIIICSFEHFLMCSLYVKKE